MSQLEKQRENISSAELERLVLAARDGDRRAGRRLYDVVMPRLFLWCRGLDHATAEDVVHDTVLVAIDPAKPYTPGGRVWGWLHRICRNNCLTILTSKRRSLERSIPTEMFAKLPGTDDEADFMEMTLEKFFNALSEALQALEPHEEEALLLQMAGERYVDIARQMGCTHHTVKNYLQVARRKVARFLRREYRGICDAHQRYLERFLGNDHE